MRVSPDGDTHFARQGNGQVFANGEGKKLGGVGSENGYMNYYLNNLLIS
jgi:hypothetical protein